MITSRRSVGCVILLAALAACSRPASAVPAATPTAPPLATSATTSPAATQLARLAPEVFWTRLYGGDPAAVDYPALAGMASDSDLVVLGSFKAVRPGPDPDAGNGLTNYMLTVDVSVERVLLGTWPSSSSTVPVAVFLGVGPSDANPYVDEIAQRAASMPQERGILFLQNIVKFYSRFDPDAAKRYDPTVYQVSSLQGVIRDNAGVSWLPANAPGSWGLTLSGKSFSTALQTVATAVATASQHP